MRPTTLFHSPLEGVPVHGTTPYAEAFVSRSMVAVDVWLPGHDPKDLEAVVARRFLRLRSKSHPEIFHVGITLPVDVDPKTYVAQWSHGVYEFRLKPSAS